MLTVRSTPASELARADAGDGFDDPDLQECDVLIVEDIQQMPARVSEAACDLIDYRASRRKPLVLTATVGPAALTHLPHRLTSPLVAGLVVQLQPYGPESRQEILDAAARAQGIRLTSEALLWLARQGGGMRASLGLLRNLGQFTFGHSGPLERQAVEDALAATGQPVPTQSDAERIVRRVADEFGVSERDLLGPSRLRTYLIPRQVAMYLTRELTSLSLPKIGSVFANRNHTTVLHACRKVAEEIAVNDSLNARMRQIRQELGTRDVKVLV